MSPLYGVGLAVAAFVGGSLLAALISWAIQRWFMRPGRVERLEHDLGLATEEQQHWKHEYEEEARKRREVTGFIEGIQAERDTWKNLYLTAGREHGIAQELMMKKIEQLAKIAKREVPEDLRALQSRYRELHGVEATRKISERIERARLPAPESLAESAAGTKGEFVLSPGTATDAVYGPATEGIATADPNRYPAKP